MNWSQLLSSMPFPILQDTTTPLLYMEHNWIIGLRLFMAKYDFNLTFTEVWTLSPQRENDKFLMHELTRMSILYSLLFIMSVYHKLNQCNGK